MATFSSFSSSSAAHWNASRLSFPARISKFQSVGGGHLVFHGASVKFCQRFCVLKQRILDGLKLQQHNRKRGPVKEFRTIKNQDDNHLKAHVETSVSHEGHVPEETSRITSPNDSSEQSSSPSFQSDGSIKEAISSGSHLSLPQKDFSAFSVEGGRKPSLCIAVIGATGELARNKIFPALFALYYSGFLPENVSIFGYSRKQLTEDELRSVIAATLTCRVDHQQDCGDKLDAFLSRTHYLNGGYNNREGMSKLNALMKHIEGDSEANRIFYLAVPQEALPEVALSLASNAQTQKGWNRIIVEKPFGFDALSSLQLTRSLVSQFEEQQIYRIDHLLGKNLIENLTVLRFSNLVFEPLWSRTYIHNVQIILSEELGIQAGRRYGIIGDIIHSHILQTIALLAMEPPVSLDGEDIRNEKVKVLRSIRELDLSDVILGQYKPTPEDNASYLDELTPTYFAAALYIDNARWDGVPFLIKTGMGLMDHRVEIRIQFNHVPGNIYRGRIGNHINHATNELILRDVPDEAILVRVNNKIPGLGLQLDVSELNLLYKDKYNIEVPDSYEHLLLDVIDGDNHLFMRSDEVAASWNILTPVIKEIDKHNIAPELYEFGGRGPVGAYYLWAKHGIQWAED